MIKNALGSVIVVACGLAVVAPAAADDALRLGDQLRLSPLVADEGAAHLSFTPRASGVFDLDTARLSLSLAPLAVDRSHASTFDGHDTVGQRFAIGGALDFGPVEVGGALAREQHGAFARQGVDASVGIGSVTTRMGYVEESGTAGDATGRYVLGADVDALPGLRVGADLSLESNAVEDEDRDAEGVVRFRLSF